MNKGASCLVILAAGVAAAGAEPPDFMSMQPGLIATPLALANAFADFGGDGDLDLSLTNTFPEIDRHSLFRNEPPGDVAGRLLQILVLDREGHATRSGSEVRLYAADGELLGSRLVPTGDGYGSQSLVPVHFGLANRAAVTVEVKFLTREGRRQ